MYKNVLKCIETYKNDKNIQKYQKIDKKVKNRIKCIKRYKIYKNI